MNPKIGEVASLPRGGKWRSRLIPYTAAIRQWRAEGKSYRQIAVLLDDLGLHISASAVNNFVRVRDDRRGRCQYTLPDESLSGAAPQIHNAGEHLEASRLEALTAIQQPNQHEMKKFIFHEQTVKRNTLMDDQLEINDPLTMQQS